MTNRKKLSVEQRKVINTLHQNGMSFREIARMTDTKLGTVHRVIKKFESEGQLESKKRTGRPRSTKERVDKRIKAIVRNNRTISASKVQSQLLSEGKQSPSISTIKRRLYEDGQFGYVARKLPFVSKVNKAKRMMFYERHALQPLAFWDRILWTDESMIRMRHSHGRMYVWRREGEEFSYECAFSTLKADNRSLMF